MVSRISIECYRKSDEGLRKSENKKVPAYFFLWTWKSEKKMQVLKVRI